MSRGARSSTAARPLVHGHIVWEYKDGVDGPLRDPNTARYIACGALAGTVIATDSHIACSG